MTKDKIHAVHVGVSGFPYGSAPINRCLFVYKSLVENDVDFLFINNKAVHGENIPVKLTKKGEFNDVKYIYTSPSPYKANSFFQKRLSNFIGVFNEILLLFRLKFTNRLDVVFYYPDGKLLKLFYYKLLSVILRFPMISHYVEYRSAFVSRKKKTFLKFSDSFFDRKFTCMVDAIVPISDFLVQKIIESKCPKPFLKIPPVTDFSLFDTPKSNVDNYFLYCGSAAYEDSYNFIIKSYNQIKENNYFLYLAINGNKAQMESLDKTIKKSPRSHLIQHYHSLTYDELIKLYRNANALLLPLTPSIQDQARFPQKIAEYLATGNPIITMNYGEIKQYFSNYENALIASTYSNDEFKELMEYVIANNKESKEIGNKGKETGLKFFHYSQYGGKLIEIINKLIYHS